MMNKDLFDSPKDAEIARLRNIIKRYKDYDEKRNKYYRDNMRRLGELESYFEELQDNKDNLMGVIIRQRDALSRLNKIIKVYKIENCNQSDNTLNEVLTIDTLKRENKSLRERCKNLKESLSAAIYKLSKFESKETENNGTSNN